MYSSTLPSTSALDGVSGQRHALAALPRGKTRYPLYMMLDGSQGRSGRVRIISSPEGFNTRTVQPVASRYSDYANPAPTMRGIQRIVFCPWNPSSCGLFLKDKCKQNEFDVCVTVRHI